MRGVSPGHLLLIVGRPHSGKTLTLLHILRYNRDKRIAFYTPDETKPLVLAKLTSLTHGIDPEELEARVADDDRDAIRLLHATVDEFPNLAVFDKKMTAYDVALAVKEATDVWGDKPELFIVDFMRLVEGETIEGKFEWLKAFGMNEQMPVIALHQMSRSAGAGGQEVTLEGGEFGGEQYATFQIGVRRKKFAIEAELREQRKKLHGRSAALAAERIDELEDDLLQHRHTVTLNLTKNKRPGGDNLDEIDYEIQRHTGRLSEIRGLSLPRQYVEQQRGQQQSWDGNW